MAEAKLSSYGQKTLAEAQAGGALFPATMNGANINVPADDFPQESAYQPHALDAVKGGLVVSQGRYTTHMKVTIGNSPVLGALVPIPGSTDAGKVLSVSNGMGELEWSDAGASGKVAVESGAVAGFLKDVLVSDSDLLDLVPVGNQLRVQINLEYSADPKIATIDESQVNSATANYGSYALQSGAERLAWGDTSSETYQWLNASVHQCMRIADAQGSITKCNVALCGSLSFQNPPPCFNVGIFDMQGNLLGQSGLRFLGVDFKSGEELCEVDMVETTEGSLSIKRNTRYIIQVWTCGLQLAALDRHDTYNYTYDYTLRQNLEGTVSRPVFLPVDSAMGRAEKIPFVTFGAASLV